MLARLVASINAWWSIVWTLDGIVMLARLVAPANAYEPILVNLLGEANDTLTRHVAPANVEPEISVEVFGMVTLPAHVPPFETTLFVIVIVPVVQDTVTALAEPTPTRKKQTTLSDNPSRRKYLYVATRQSSFQGCVSGQTPIEGVPSR